MSNSPMNHPILLVIHLDELAEATAIIIVCSFCVTESLKHGSGAEDRLLDTTSVRTLLAQGGEMMEQEIRRLGFTGTALATYHNALILLLLEHAMIRRVGYREYVWRYVRTEPSILIKIHILRIVNRVEFEGVQGDQYAADVGVNVAGEKSRAKIVQ